MALVTLTSQTHAVEPWREMVDGLSARGWFDTAVDFLEYLKTSPALADEVSGMLTYEQGLVYIHAGTAIPDDSVKEKQFTEASKKLAEFLVKLIRQSELVAGANNQIASIFLMWAGQVGNGPAAARKQGQARRRSPEFARRGPQTVRGCGAESSGPGQEVSCGSCCRRARDGGQEAASLRRSGPNRNFAMPRLTMSWPAHRRPTAPC